MLKNQEWKTYVATADTDRWKQGNARLSEVEYVMRNILSLSPNTIYTINKDY